VSLTQKIHAQLKYKNLALNLLAEKGVCADLILTNIGCVVKIGLVYVVNPRLAWYFMGLSESSDILILFLTCPLWPYESNGSSPRVQG